VSNEQEKKKKKLCSKQQEELRFPPKSSTEKIHLQIGGKKSRI